MCIRDSYWTINEMSNTSKKNRLISSASISYKITDKLKFKLSKPVPKEVLEEVKTYFVIYIFLVIIFTILISFSVPDFLTAFSAVMATFNNIGPGMGIVGPTGSYASLTDFNKIVLSFAMLAGRLEIFPILTVSYTHLDVYKRQSWIIGIYSCTSLCL